MDDDFQTQFEDTRSTLDRFDAMMRVAAQKFAPGEVDAQYAYMTGMLMQELRMLAYRYPDVANDIARTAASLEKQYVVDVLSNDATVES